MSTMQPSKVTFKLVIPWIVSLLVYLVDSTSYFFSDHEYSIARHQMKKSMHKNSCCTIGFGCSLNRTLFGVFCYTN
jgi:hypothetical protein